jgi:hypothetical protein
MAETIRSRTVANKGGRMTPKQIKYFGTARQRAALRSRKSRERSNSRRANARAKSRSNRAKKNRSHSHRSNRGEIIGFTLPNTGRKKRSNTHMAAKKNKAKGSRHHKHHAGYGSRRHHTKMNRGRRHRRNQGMGASGIGHIVTNAIFVIAGALGSKLLTQLVLGSNNTGLIGYAGNAIAGGAMWFVTEKIMRNRVASEGIIAGTAVQIILRLINDYTPFGQYVSQLGMGDYQAQAFVTPQVLVDPYNSAQIRIPGAWLPPPPPPATVSAASAAAGVSGFDQLYGGKASLY